MELELEFDDVEDETEAVADHDAPAAASLPACDESVAVLSFADHGLDDRLLKAVARLGWITPTPVQNRVIPEVFRGKDVLCRGRTGSGKTGAYALPLIHALLQAKKGNPGSAGVLACVLLPSRELAQQVTKCFKDLTMFCSKTLRVMDLSGDAVTKQAITAGAPDIAVGTPARLLALINSQAVDLTTAVTHLVVDEADLLLSYGHEADVAALLNHLPRIMQTMLMSATLSTDVARLTTLVLRDPAVVKLQEADLPSGAQLSQHSIHCEPDDKFLIVYALLKLKLLTGKTIIFVNDTDRCYKLKLFLEQFSIKACVLNAELPLNSRYHIVQQFNKGIYDYIIASDDAVKLPASSASEKASKKKKKAKGAVSDAEFGVSRGIDFQDVRNVFNFDFPATPEATARGLNVGVALSLLCHSDAGILAQTKALLGDSAALQPYAFKMEAIEGLRYRARDALRAVTRVSIRDARRKELSEEILNSEKLKAHFEDNPRDMAVLRHDKNLLHPRRIHVHMRHVPFYLLPKGISEESVRVAMPDVRARKRKGAATRDAPNKKQKTMQNPLKSFRFQGAKPGPQTSSDS